METSRPDEDHRLPRGDAMIQCDGQINMFDFIKESRVANQEIPILLRDGQTIYKVVRGDVETQVVNGKSWICSENNRGYRLKREYGWDCTWNSQFGKVVFDDLETARAVADKYLSQNEHILGKDIRAVKVTAYRYERSDGYEIINFYAELENGDVYFNYGCMYEHIGKASEIKDFEEERQTNIRFPGYEELEDYQPQYANMYKCHKRGSWLYAAARYEFSL